MNIESVGAFKILIIIYSLFSISFLINWIRFKLFNPSLYPEDKFIYLIVMLFITVFWVFAPPLYLIKFLRKS
ncbi:hypothetical protein NIES267_69970 [Calothrix parasitica NIES-267]|uniref:Uncharacterized protein n=1 Tax=Calothrix parasitica NIES-267 TaxID=1973488 RepID=A0A1Z4M1Y5_9CYAN|nr:hypothetical protein NIES267_69970 [Calothrix parasitica NIES-267]